MSAWLRRHRARILVYGTLLLAIPATWYLRSTIRTLLQKGELRWPRGVDAVLREHEPAVRARYEPVLHAVGREWPPEKLVLVAFKQELRLEAWDEAPEIPIRIASWPILAASGAGHKLRRSDGQVPEGLYELTTLNPDSLYHLSVRVDYPNADDRAHAVAADLGDDIYVHGMDVSIGCLAIGNDAIEEVFTLAARAKSRRIVISPVDFRTGATPPDPGHDFLRARYAELASELVRFPRE
jgi:hypothetical protein